MPSIDVLSFYSLIFLHNFILTLMNVDHFNIFLIAFLSFLFSTEPFLLPDPTSVHAHTYACVCVPGPLSLTRVVCMSIDGVI